MQISQEKQKAGQEEESYARRMTETAEKTEIKHPCEVILAIAEHGLSEELVRSLVGDKVAAMHEEVGDCFGRSSNTISNSWVSIGMPGAGIAGRGGEYPLAEILVWMLGSLSPKRKYQSEHNSDVKRRHAEEELRKLTAQADHVEREEQTAMGNLIDRRDMVVSLRAMIAAPVEHLSGLSDKIAPRLPVGQASDIVEDIRCEIQRHLTHFSESVVREIVERYGPGPEECRCKLP